jgi:GTPase-activating protein SAC7
VPSRRAGSTNHSPRFSREKTSDPPTPSPGLVTTQEVIAPGRQERQESIQSTPIATTAPPFPPVQPPEVTSASSSEVTTPMAGVGSDTASTVKSDYTTPKKDTTPLLAPPIGSADHQSERSPSNTPSASSARGFLDIFKQSPTSDSEGRKPNKLQKKRIPGSALSSAQSSTHSLDAQAPHDSTQQRSPSTPVFPSGASQAQIENAEDRSTYAMAQTTPVQPTPQRNPTDATLRPATSPTQSYHSTDLSDAEMVGDDLPPAAHDPNDRRKKKGHRWRFSRSQNKLDQPQTPGSTRDNPMGNMAAKELTTSKSTIGSSTGVPRRSFQEPTPLAPSATDPASGTPMPSQSIHSSSTDPVFSDSEREKKGPMSWIRGKIQERRDKDAEKRAKTPERNRDRNSSKQDLRLPSEAVPARGKSVDLQREQQQQQRSAAAAGTISQSTVVPGQAPAGQAPAFALSSAASPQSAGSQSATMTTTSPSTGAPTESVMREQL